MIDIHITANDDDIGHNMIESPSSTSTTTDEVAIRSLYQQLMDGWNKGSGEAFAAPFADDGDLVGFDGTHLKGRKQIVSFHQQLFNSYVKGSRLVGKVRKVRFLTPNVALMHVVGGTIMASQTDIDPERNSVLTLVAMKDNKGEWCLAAFQNTRAQYFGRPEQAQALTEELRSLV
jgi:uncharacterized protein (TIGR02246 family)